MASVRTETAKQAGGFAGTVAAMKGRLRSDVLTFNNLCVVLLVCIFALPQYFGIPTPAFAFTAQRIVLVLVLLAIGLSRERARDCWNIFINNKFIIPCVPLLVVSAYTAIIRQAPTTFLQIVFDNVIPFLIVVYLAWRCMSVEEIVDILVKIFVVVCCIAVFDAFRRWNPYDLIHTIKSVRGGSGWRVSSYRVAAMCSHPIGFGLYIILMLPVICADTKHNKVNLFKHPVALTLAVICALETGSRFPQAMFAVEIVVFYCLTDRDVRNRVSGYLLTTLITVVLLCVILREEPHMKRWVWVNVYQVVDALFHTNFTETEIGHWQMVFTDASKSYRDLLPQIFFMTDKFDPLIGGGYTESKLIIDGTNVMRSIDNNYVCVFMDLAWPGVIATIAIYAYMLYAAFLGWTRHQSTLCLCMGIAMLLYFFCLWFVAYLNTYKFLFALFGLVYAVCFNEKGTIYSSGIIVRSAQANSQKKHANL